ncbi:MAG: AI-2E family transporter [Legionella sp.]|nr:MAG: AI-2E family transporter [Legionella sp.]PJD99571.1 MAG: AI-2E family transporter [Legionella sp.]
MNRTVTFASILIILCIIGTFLIIGRGLLMPLVMAIFIWHLLNTINNGVKKISIVGKQFPSGVSMLVSLLLVVGFCKILVEIITNNVADVIAATPKYQENLLAIFDKIDSRFHLKSLIGFDDAMKNINFQSIAMNMYGVFSTITSSAILISFYVVFLFIEQHYFEQKLEAFFVQPEHRKVVRNIISHITKDTQTYLGIKTFLGLVTSVISWMIMRAVGLDFAEFWALLIFFLTYIPNIGAIIATVFPVALAFIQFDSWLPFIEVTSGVVLLQFIIGNFLEPRLLGKSLNLSTLVILFSLALWGYIWGILGMFLSVPITVMMMIIFAHFDATRPLAILLSQDGYVYKAYEALDESF